MGSRGFGFRVASLAECQEIWDAFLVEFNNDVPERQIRPSTSGFRVYGFTKP